MSRDSIDIHFQYRRHAPGEAQPMPQVPTSTADTCSVFYELRNEGLMTIDACCTQPTVPFEAQPEHDAQLATLCRALGHPHRVHILRFLISQNACFAGEIAEQLPVAASTVSQHLKQLKDAGLIQGEVSGPRRCYCVEPQTLGLLKTLMEAL